MPRVEREFRSTISFEHALVTLNNNRFILILILQQNKILLSFPSTHLHLLHLLLRLHDVPHYLHPYPLRLLQLVVPLLQNYLARYVLVIHLRVLNQVLKYLRCAIYVTLHVYVKDLFVFWSGRQLFKANSGPFDEFCPFRHQIIVLLLHLFNGFFEPNHFSE